MIRQIMLDADGVIQRGGDEIADALERHLGSDAMEFLAETFPRDSPVLRGETEVVPLLRKALAETGRDGDVERLYAEAWLEIEIHQPTVELVHALRAQGYGVHLGTNQDLGRARYMRAELDYDNLFDLSIYSCEIGATKPFAEFFTAATSAIGGDPAQILFVDDNLDNVVGARDAGLRAIQWQIDDGHDALLTQLAEYNLRL